ncbi:phosphoenolpyruvate--protein phosphotransferase [Geothrix sp.]|jgi:fructose-specific PTS system IIA-like component|uniref:phosphoenolpyruvate--protein phosphotransferase n=1 Tax=Geothrix sp. TaxID=1962974 RepID=UPI0025C32925|nr:phosphoenolpyruvate--protein phosphotransferase [Geothrix sp.]
MDYAFDFPLAGGLHAWPAAALRERSAAHSARLEFLNERTGRTASLDSVLGLLATDTRKGDPCRIRVETGDEAEAHRDLVAFLQGPFLSCDRSAVPGARTSSVVPRLVERAGGRWWAGVGVSEGVGTGQLVRLTVAAPRPAQGLLGEAPVEVERKALQLALETVGDRLKEEIRHAAHPAQRSVLEVHLALLGDPTWRDGIEAALLEGLTAAGAVEAATRSAEGPLARSEHAAIRERALDLQDVADRLIRELCGEDPEASRLRLTAPSVLVADRLAPSRLLALDLELLRGLVLAEGGGTSHTAILARSFGIPCVTALVPEALEGRRLLVDGLRGLVIAEPTPEVEAYYRVEAEGQRQRMGQQRGRPAAWVGARTQDGHEVRVLGNISTAEETSRALGAGADGIGLFRTEMLFLHRPAPPGEDEQVQAYGRVLREAAGRPVTLRLLDVGGDKPLAYLPLLPEMNPFLGRRGVRWYAEQVDLVRTQLRAALRAAAHGPLRLMIPMVAEVEELRWVRALMEEVRASLVAEGVNLPEVPLGIMVEVPAAALNLEALGREADFLSVGTNDLVQYLFAADRGDAGVAKACHEWHPATLRLLAHIAQGARAAGKPVSICGEMASRPKLLPLLLGLGFDDLSVAPSAVAAIRHALAPLDLEACLDLTRRALRAATATEVEGLLDEALRPGVAPPLLDPDLVVLEAACGTKEEAIKLLVERLASAGRTRDPLDLEEAIWAREAAYATGLGFGFAVPHCKSPAVAANAIAILRLAAPVAWSDDAEARLVFLLISRPDGEDEHLRIFARLARRLMDAGFRQGLLEAPDTEALLDLLRPDLSA